MPLPTGSAITRADHCPPSCALPRVRSTNPDAEWGKAGHLYLQDVGSGTEPVKALESVQEEHRDMCSQLDLAGLPFGEKCAQEVAYAFDLDTGRSRLLGTGLDRDYSSALPREIVGAIDVAKADCTGVFDYKFDGYETHCPPVARNHQIKFAALCSSRIRSVDKVDGTLIHFRPDGSHWADSFTFDALALDEFELELRAIARRVDEADAIVSAGRTPNVSRGEWCRYCPSIAACPAVAGLVRSVARSPETMAQVILAAITPETAALAYVRMREVQSVMKEVSSALYLFASEQPIEIGDGRVYGPVRSQRREIDARIARKVLAEMHGPEVAEAACEFETSAEAVERAMRPVYKVRKREADEAKARGENPVRVTIKALKDAAIAEIAKSGGVEFRETTTVKEHHVRNRKGLPNTLDVAQGANSLR